LDLLTRLKVI